MLAACPVPSHPAAHTAITKAGAFAVFLFANPHFQLYRLAVFAIFKSIFGQQAAL